MNIGNYSRNEKTIILSHIKVKIELGLGFKEHLVALVECV
jgi:hypothetical protein